MDNTSLKQLSEYVSLMLLFPKIPNILKYLSLQIKFHELLLKI